MEKELNYFSVSMKKIEGTANEYEMVSKLNPCFSILPAEKLKQVEDIALRAIEEIQEVLKSNSGKTVRPIE